MAGVVILAGAVVPGVETPGVVMRHRVMRLKVMRLSKLRLLRQLNKLPDKTYQNKGQPAGCPFLCPLDSPGNRVGFTLLDLLVMAKHFLESAFKKLA